MTKRHLGATLAHMTTKTQAANLAILKAGGVTKMARDLSELSGKPCTRHVIGKWRERGVSAHWVAYVADLTGVKANLLAPHIFLEGNK